MDERDDAPIPPLPIGDGLGAPTASTDAFRQVLRRHQRRQVQVLVGFLAAAVVAGSVAGFAIGRGGNGEPGTRVAAGNPPNSSQPAASSSAANAVVPQGGAIGAAPVGAIGKGPSTQLLVRDASDGTRVRLYEQSFSVPTITCSGNQACPQPTIACAPTGLLMAEVSDDQVAGQTASPEWLPVTTTGLQPLAAEVIGGGQPQPILVVIAHAGSPVAKVTLSTPDGSDSMAPAGSGWVALAVRLRPDYQGSVSNDLPSGTVTALSSTGATVSSTAVQDIATKVVPPACMVPGCEIAGGSKPTTQPATGTKGATQATTGQATTGQATTGPAMLCKPCPPAAVNPPPSPGQSTSGRAPNGNGAVSSVAVACGVGGGIAGASAGSAGAGVAPAASGSTSSAP